jgi:superfamily I DNA/RNA helicase
VPVDTGMPEGSVTFRIFPDDRPASEYRDFICTRLMDELNRLLLSGYKASEIAVLTRTNPEAVKIAEYIISFKNSHPELPYSLEVISDEALLVSGSSCVCFIVSLLKHLVDPLDKTNNYHIITEYVNYIEPEAANEFWRVAEEVYPSWQKSLYDILPEGFLSFMSTAGKSSLSELVAGMINLFSLSRMQNELVYLLAFQDIVLDFTNRHSSDPLMFLEYWDETGKDKAITAPASQEAVRILTIHKAKGLEFDVVLVPFCNWKIISQGDIMWCSAGEFGEDGPGYFPVKFATSLSRHFSRIIILMK